MLLLLLEDEEEEEEAEQTRSLPCSCAPEVGNTHEHRPTAAVLAPHTVTRRVGVCAVANSCVFTRAASRLHCLRVTEPAAQAAEQHDISMLCNDVTV